MSFQNDIRRHKAIRIALYNHKGGVGKTTLTANIAATIASSGKNVLLVDSDPQCNVTSYFIDESVVDNLLDESDSKDGRTLWSALKPIVEATGDYKYIEPYETSVNSLSLFPGDIRLAEFESELDGFWAECLQRKIKGFKGTNSLSCLVNECAKHLKADYIFYDTGPNIGPLNRVVMLDCDYFIVPVACDLFSRRALKSLGHRLADWIQSWATILSLAPNDTYLMRGKPKFLGYIPQRFKTYGGMMTSTHASFIPPIEKIISSDIITVLRKIDSSLSPSSVSGTKLGEVKDFSTLVQQAARAGVPLKDVFGGTEYQKSEAQIAFSEISKKIMAKVG